jgi:hypothetical protein
MIFFPSSPASPTLAVSGGCRAQQRLRGMLLPAADEKRLNADHGVPLVNVNQNDNISIMQLYAIAQ